MSGLNVVDRPGRSPCLSLVVLGAVLAFALASQPVIAGVIMIGEGSSVSTGAGQIELGCGDAEIAGGLAGSLVGARNLYFAPGAATAGASLSLSGDWVNNGPRGLDAIVDWSDGCGVIESSMLGSSDLTALNITSSSGREIRFDANGEQHVGSNLRLMGAADQRLRLRSTASGQFANVSLDFGASQLIDWVDVADIDSSAGREIAPGMPADYNSLRSGPVRNWFEMPAVPVSTLGSVSTLLLILLMGLLGLFRQRPSS